MTATMKKSDRNVPPDVRERESYDPKTGLFRALKSSGSLSSGKICGYVASGGYVRMYFDRKYVFAHRLAWFCVYGKFPKGEIDHINGDCADNRICNLRDVSHAKNMKNRKIQKNNKSGTSGIHYCKGLESWRARIKVNGAFISLGYFKDLNDAVAARLAAEKQYDFHANHGRDV